MSDLTLMTAMSDLTLMTVAMLEDRVRIKEGKPQPYGSQLSGNPLGFDSTTPSASG